MFAIADMICNVFDLINKYKYLDVYLVDHMLLA